MNVNTGELRLLASGSGREQELTRLLIEGFIPVPAEHEKEAADILAAQNQVIVDMTMDTPLVNWAKSKQIVHKSDTKSKRSMRKRSQRINRKN